MEHMMLLVTYRMLPGQRDAFLQEVAAAGIGFCLLGGSKDDPWRT